MASSVLRTALSRSLRVSARVAPRMARNMSKKADKGDASNFSHSEITKMFLEMDAAAPASSGAELPLKLTGRSGELVETLYNNTSKTKNGFEKAVKEVEGVVSAVQNAGLVVDRFFSAVNYSPEECQLVVDLILTNKEPLTSFDSIKNADVKDLLVDNESNLDTWRTVRKQVQALNLSDDVKNVLDSLAKEGRLDLLKKVAEKGSLLRSVASKAVEVQVSSAVALSKEQQAAITKSLPTYAPAGTTLNVNFIVDPAVMGGLLISLENKIIDLSAASRLVELAAAARAQKLA